MDYYILLQSSITQSYNQLSFTRKLLVFRPGFMKCRLNAGAKWWKVGNRSAISIWCSCNRWKRLVIVQVQRHREGCTESSGFDCLNSDWRRMCISLCGDMKSTDFNVHSTSSSAKYWDSKEDWLDAGVQIVIFAWLWWADYTVKQAQHTMRKSSVAGVYGLHEVESQACGWYERPCKEIKPRSTSVKECWLNADGLHLNSMIDGGHCEGTKGHLNKSLATRKPADVSPNA